MWKTFYNRAPLKPALTANQCWRNCARPWVSGLWCSLLKHSYLSYLSNIRASHSAERGTHSQTVCSIPAAHGPGGSSPRSEEHTSELQSRGQLVCRLLLEKKKCAREEAIVLADAGGDRCAASRPRRRPLAGPAPLRSITVLSGLPRRRCSSLFPYTTLFRSNILISLIFQIFELRTAQSAAHIPRPCAASLLHTVPEVAHQDRKSTRLNSSHVASSYAVFCLKKKSVREKKRSCWRMLAETAVRRRVRGGAPSLGLPPSVPSPFSPVSRAGGALHSFPTRRSSDLTFLSLLSFKYSSFAQRRARHTFPDRVQHPCCTRSRR